MDLICPLPLPVEDEPFRPRVLRSWHDPEQRRTAKSLAIIVVDIDHFKRINDTHGHLAGDALYLAKQGGRNRAVGVQEGPSRSGEALSALRKASHGLAEAQESGAVRIV